LPKHKKRPTVNAYYGTEAEDYAQSNWMARNQRSTSETTMQLLISDQMGGDLESEPEESLVLDIGCGTGYSSKRFAEEGFHVIGIDRSRDMLQKMSDISRYNIIEADMRAIPLRSTLFDIVFSISAFNFASDGAHDSTEARMKINSALKELHRVLHDGSRVVIEFYPTLTEEQIFLSELKHFPFVGGLLIQNPKGKKEQKFLLLTNCNLSK
jgi:ubiquinone/menaquinone biosynthesis C-methylase UbiE